MSATAELPSGSVENNLSQFGKVSDRCRVRAEHGRWNGRWVNAKTRGKWQRDLLADSASEKPSDRRVIHP